MTTDYHCELNLEVANESHTQILRRIHRGARVLELGCATGDMSKVLTRDLQCTVFGVERNADAADKARTHCAQVIVADLDDSGWLEPIADERFDVITCADVIEHLVDPVAALERSRGLLKPDGCLLASIPNGAHVALRLELLEGRFHYEDSGLLDRTHLHFFTHTSVQTLFQRAGYAVEELSYTFRDLPDSIIGERLARMGLEPSEKTLALLHAPEAVAFQFIVRALPAQSASSTVHELTDLPLQDSLEYTRNLLEELHQTRLVAQDRQRVIDDQARNLEVRQQALEQAAEEKEAALKKNKADARRSAGEIGALRDELSAQAGQYELTTQAIREKDAIIRHLQGLVTKEKREVAALRGSVGWRFWLLASRPAKTARELPARIRDARRDWSGYRRASRLRRRLLHLGGTRALENYHNLRAQALPDALDPVYRTWIETQEARKEPSYDGVHDWVESLDPVIRFSIVMPVYNAAEGWLRAAIESVLAQSYPFWELLLVDDASIEPRVAPILKEYALSDGRIRCIFRSENGHIAVASNTGLDAAKGDYVAFMDHDDLLPPHALYHVVREIREHPDAAVIYSDEDKITEHDQRFAHYFKPDYNPDLMLSHNMVCHLGVYRRSLLDELGGFRSEFDGAQDYDLALRAIERAGPERVRHIPRILYHWRAVPQSTASGADAKPYALNAAIRAVTEHLERTGAPGAEVRPSELIHGMLRVRYGLPEPAPLVSIIMPTRNGYDLISTCLESLFRKTEYGSYEVLVVDNQSDDPQTLDYLEGLDAEGRIRLLRYSKPFNYSAINNFAVKEARGDVLAFLNNDLEAISGDWLTEMVSHAVRPAIGAVGARLWYPNDTLQHGGVVLGLGGVAGHAMKHFRREDRGYNARAVLIQNYSAVTAACMVIERRAFDRVGGFDEVNLPVAFNDVDFCLRLREVGYRNLWTPYAELWHHESASRGPEDTLEKQRRFGKEIDYMRRRWGTTLDTDPAYNPNLTRGAENFGLG
ncbi:MAG: glycosyltransferase [Pseudomonadota bacterium]|nr:glycosyltransferase [Pseudomonadota bacterium]